MGSYSTPEQNVWTLTGCYTPYEGTNYNYTPDGWLYGTKIIKIEPEQYNMNPDKDGNISGEIIGYSGSLEVMQADNGLWYYVSVPQSVKGDPLLQDIVYPEFERDPQTQEIIKIKDTSG